MTTNKISLISGQPKPHNETLSQNKKANKQANKQIKLNPLPAKVSLHVYNYFKYFIIIWYSENYF